MAATFRLLQGKAGNGAVALNVAETQRKLVVAGSVTEVLDAIAGHAGPLNGVAASTALRQLAVLHRGGSMRWARDPAYSVLQRELCRLLPKETGRVAATVLWAQATLRAADRRVTALACEVVCRAQLKPQEVSIAAWAVGTLSFEFPGFWPSVAVAADAAGLRLAANKFSSQNLSNLVWAVAAARALDPGPPGAAAALGPAAPARVSSVASAGSPQAGAGPGAQQLVAWVGDCVRGRPEEFSTRECANVLWALARVQHADEPAFRALGECSVPKLLDWPGRDLANAMWAFWAAQVEGGRQFVAAGEEALEASGFHRLDDQHLVAISGIMSRWRSARPAACAQLAVEARRRLAAPAEASEGAVRPGRAAHADPIGRVSAGRNAPAEAAQGCGSTRRHGGGGSPVTHGGVRAQPTGPGAVRRSPDTPWLSAYNVGSSVFHSTAKAARAEARAEVVRLGGALVAGVPGAEVGDLMDLVRGCAEVAAWSQEDHGG
mmetsp:Transcript_68723/g.183098  ORF Transcript_68723/g.183098 Transcript_68723/m.183098 type:complete len:491 (+) Transcript_68723:24-1496(+)